MAVRATLSGSVSIAPPSGSSTGTTTGRAISQCGTYAFDEKHTFHGAQADTVVGLGPITSVKMLVGYAASPIDLKITSLNGTDAIVPLDGHFAIHCPNRPITAMKLNGTADGELLFAGD